MERLSSNNADKSGSVTRRKIKPDSYIAPNIKVNSKWVKGLAIGPESIKYTKQNNDMKPERYVRRQGICLAHLTLVCP